MFGTALYTFACAIGACWAYRDVGAFRSGVNWILDKIDPDDPGETVKREPKTPEKEEKPSSEVPESDK